jgi:hypothetical protein
MDKQKLDFLFSLSNDKKTLIMSINGKTKKIDLEDGTLKIDLDEVLVSHDRSFYEFDRIVQNDLGELQRIIMYNSFITCTQLGKKELINMLNIDKHKMEKITALGIMNGVFRKIGSQLALANEEIKGLVKVFLSKKEIEEGKEQIINPMEAIRDMKEQNEVKELPKRKKVK